MASRRFPLLIFGLLLACPLPAQERPLGDSLEQENLTHAETDAVLLGKSRAALLESLKAADTTKARKVLQYMETKFDLKRMLVLYPSEELLVAYTLGDYTTILSFAKRFDAEENALERIAPDPDQFYDDMIDLSRRNEGRLRMDVRRSDLAPHERDFALLLLTDMLGREKGDEMQRDAFQSTINEAADSYLSSYAGSEYNPFVRKYIRFVMVKSMWGYGYGAALGYLSLPATMSRHIGDYALLSFYAEGVYKQAYACLGLDVGLARSITSEFEYNGTWQEGLSVMHFSGLLAVGPMLELGSGFLAIPTAGISFMDFSPPENEKEKSGIDVSMSFAAWALGASFRIPIGGEDGRLFITINAGYRKAMTSIELAKGGYTFLTIGLGVFDRPPERDF